MSKKFEYELMLRLEKAEKSVASLATKIEKDLGKAVETAFQGSSEFDFSKHKDNLQEMVRSANALHENQKEAAQYTLRLEKERLDVVRDRIKAEMEAADAATRDAYERRQAESNLQAEEDRKRAERQRGLEQAFSAGVPLELQEKADAEEQARLIRWANEQDARRRESAAEDQRIREERQKADEAEQARLTKIANESDARKRSEAEKDKQIEEDRLKNLQAHGDRLDANQKKLQGYYDKYKDPDVQASIQAVKDNLDSHSAALQVSGKSLAEQNKEHTRLTDKEIENLDKLVGKEQKATQDRLAQIRTTEAADKAARTVRYTHHQDVLRVIEAAETINAQKLAELEQSITNMTEAQAKDRIDAYKKEAKARIDFAIEAGYKVENEILRQSSAGAKGVSAIFQAQQAIEDSMYAGMRGAGNNLAFLLTSITNPWVAIGGLIGIATLQLADHLGVTEKINESLDGMLWKTKEQVQYEEQLAKLRGDAFDRAQKQRIDALSFDPASKTVEKAQKDVEVAKQKLAIEQETENKLRTAVGLYEQIQTQKAIISQEESVAAARILASTFEGKLDTKSIAALFPGMSEESLAATESIRNLQRRFEDLGLSFQANEADYETMKKKLSEMGASGVATAAELKVLEDQLKKVREAAAITEEQQFLKNSALDLINEQIEASKLVVKSREDELQAIQRAVTATQQALDTERKRTEAIKEAASAREDEVAKQRLGLQNTILDMEANEKIKTAKESAQSKEQGIQEQARRARQWAEQQAKVDKFNVGQLKKSGQFNPQMNFDIDEQKAKYLQGVDFWEKSELAKIKKMEQASIDSAKKVAENAKQANLDSMEAVQKRKFDALKADAEQLLGQGRFGEAQTALDKAQKTLKEMADAKVGNLKQKDSVQQGKDALKDWEALQKQIKEIDDQKLAVSDKAQEAEKQRLLQQRALEDQAAARLETVQAAHEQLLKVKEMIKDTPMIAPNELDAVAKFRAEMERILALRLQIGSAGNAPALNGAGVPIQGPMPAPGMGGGGAGGAPGLPAGPNIPGLPNPFSLTFNMNNASPNAVAAAANSIVQSQKALAMLGGN